MRDAMGVASAPAIASADVAPRPGGALVAAGEDVSVAHVCDGDPLRCRPAEGDGTVALSATSLINDGRLVRVDGRAARGSPADGGAHRAVRAERHRRLADRAHRDGRRRDLRGLGLPRRGAGRGGPRRQRVDAGERRKPAARGDRDAARLRPPLRLGHARLHGRGSDPRERLGSGRRSARGARAGVAPHGRRRRDVLRPSSSPAPSRTAPPSSTRSRPTRASSSAAPGSTARSSSRRAT